MANVAERVIPAIVEFVNGDLAAFPHRVGKLLERELAGSYSARRGSYRILYDIDYDKNQVSILRVAHRADQPPIYDISTFRAPGFVSPRVCSPRISE